MMCRSSDCFRCPRASPLLSALPFQRGAQISAAPSGAFKVCGKYHSCSLLQGSSLIDSQKRTHTDTGQEHGHKSEFLVAYFTLCLRHAALLIRALDSLFAFCHRLNLTYSNMLAFTAKLRGHKTSTLCLVGKLHQEARGRIVTCSFREMWL